LAIKREILLNYEVVHAVTPRHSKNNLLEEEAWFVTFAASEQGSTI
jgi:hypothetical protein